MADKKQTNKKKHSARMEGMKSLIRQKISEMKKKKDDDKEDDKSMNKKEEDNKNQERYNKEQEGL